jgi:hypothetical protein
MNLILLGSDCGDIRERSTIAAGDNEMEIAGSNVSLGNS